MSWHFKPNPNRWDKFFDEEVLTIYFALTGQEPVKIDEQKKLRIIGKLTTELQGYANEIKKYGPKLM